MKYHPVVQILHWMMAALFITIIVTVEFTFQDRKSAMLVHKAFGLLVLLLLIVRVLSRITTTAPPSDGSAWSKFASLAHLFLYFLMVAVPLTMVVGGLHGRGLDFFSLHIDPIWANKELASQMMAVHRLLANIFLYTALAHAAAALAHHFFLKDATLKKMLP